LIGWFHPLVWNVRAAHSLACEQEADRIAAAQLDHRGFYAQLLARLASSFHRAPPPHSG
jgi:beta-lactamase regulating signal transducer with metallopeptidase domain